MPVHVVAVPERYEPSWRDLPGLALVAARAYRPTWAPTRAAAVMAACSLLVWLPIVATMHAKHHLAALERHAMVEVVPVNRPASHGIPGLVTAACLMAVFVTILVPALVVAELALQAGAGPNLATVAGSAACAVLVGLGVLPMLAEAPKIIRSRTVLDRTIRALSAQSPAAPICRIGSLAAWPQRRGHGSELLDGLLREWCAGGFAVCFPRDERVERLYLDRGMQRWPTDGGLFLDMRANGPTP